MVSQFDPDGKREIIHNRWGDEIGVIYLKNGYWEFVRDPYYSEPVFTPSELAYIEKRQQELNT